MVFEKKTSLAATSIRTPKHYSNANEKDKDTGKELNIYA
jgi:hypothetical protein